MIDVRADRLTAFYQKVADDGRISPTHISIYFSLVNESAGLYEIHFFLRKQVVMSHAKINSPVTLSKCLRDLAEYGYIHYKPSFSPGNTTVAIRLLAGK